MTMNKAIDIEQMTPEWLTDALGYEVRSFTSERVGTGQMGMSFRLTLDADQGPKTVLAKMAGGEMESRNQVKGGYKAEVSFYADMVDELAVRTPDCYFSAISDDGLTFVLLLEDLAPRKPGVQAEACSLERARASLINLSGLHAPRWNDETLYNEYHLLGTKGRLGPDILAKMTREATAQFVERFPEQLGPDDVDTLQKAAAVIEPWMTANQTPFCVLHGDYRLDNLMFGEQADDVVALDWQTVGVGAPTRDLSYFTGTCLHIEDRRAHEQELVALYHEQLQKRGVSDYSLEQCFADYRRDHMQAVFITTTGCIYARGEQSEESDGMFLAMAKRSCAAIRDLDTLSLM